MHVSEILQLYGHRRLRLLEANRKKINDLVNKHTWEIISDKNMSSSAYVPGERFVLSIKDEARIIKFEMYFL